MKRALLLALAGVAAVAALGYGTYAWRYSVAHVWTDDAYVGPVGDRLPVADPQVGHRALRHAGDGDADISYTQKLLGYDAWTAGTVLAPGGIGNLISLVVAGRLVAHVDQRGLFAVGCALNAAGLYFMSNLTLGVDYWTLVWPRFVQGLGLGLTFVPLTTLALGTIPRERLSNATAAYNVIRNIGGSAGIALFVTLLSRRSQAHQVTLIGHVNEWNSETAAGLRAWTDHFLAQGADLVTAERQALGMLYQRTLEQAQVLAYSDDFWLLSLLFLLVICLLPFIRRVRAEPHDPCQARPLGRVEGLPAATD